MNDEQGLFDILEKIQQWHNDKMRGMQYDKKQLRDLRLKIIELAGLDTDKIITICDNLDGCAFEILQGDAPDIMGETQDIDKYASDLRALVENIGG